MKKSGNRNEKSGINWLYHFRLELYKEELNRLKQEKSEITLMEKIKLQIDFNLIQLPNLLIYVTQLSHEEMNELHDYFLQRNRNSML